MSVARMAMWPRPAKAAAAGFVALTALAAASGPAQAQDREIVVTIKTVRALDKLDVFSRADFFGRVTIAGGQPLATPSVKQQDVISPNWVIRKRVGNGQHNVRLEILDKDVTKSDLVDINRLPGRRVLEFTVDTRSCVIGGFSAGYKCGDTITRGGNERRKAEVSFTVEVNR